MVTKSAVLKQVKDMTPHKMTAMYLLLKKKINRRVRHPRAM